MRKYLNGSNVPLSMAVFLATDSYDHNDECISVTTLLKPLKQIILSSRVPQDQGLADIQGLVQSRMGTAIHDGIECAWLSNHKEAMAALGYPQRIIDRVLVNPTPDQLFDGCIPVYLERRSDRMVLGRKVSGKFDFVGDGRLEDFKSTSVYTWIHGTKDDDYIWQGSLYRWLNQDIITSDEMAIQFLFTDWSAMGARQDSKYPQQRTLQKTYPLKSVEEAEHFVTSKIRLLDRYWDADEADIPNCSDVELWRSEPKYKYYKDPAKASLGGRSTKNFDDKQAAYIHRGQQGVGVVVEVPGEVKACRYCAGFAICNQAKNLIATGNLTL